MYKKLCQDPKGSTGEVTLRRMIDQKLNSSIRSWTAGTLETSRFKGHKVNRKGAQSSPQPCSIARHEHHEWQKYLAG